MIKPIQITVGAGGYNPADGDTEYNNPDLAGLDGYVDKSGFGTWTYENYEIIPTGGFRLLNGFTFDDGAVFFFFPTAYSSLTGSATYTNGFHYSKILTAMLGRLAWKQPTESEYAILDTANTTTRSGRYFNDFHAICNAVNLKMVCDDPAIGSLAFNAYLWSLQKSVILDALSSVFSETEYLCQSLCYDRYGWNDQPLTNTGKFVGIKIISPRNAGLATQINSLYLMFDKAVTFNVYLFHEAKKAPVKTISVTTVANSQTVVPVTDCILNYLSDSVGSGAYYLGYFQDDIEALGAKAIRESNTCQKANLPFGHCYFMANKATGTDFERSNISHGSDPYGINAFISVWRDHVPSIINNVPLFDNLIGYKMAAKVAEIIMFTKRSNADERILKEANDRLMVYLDMKGTVPITDAPRVEGIAQKIQYEIVKVKRGFFPKQTAQTVDLC